jgi:hypothetical protein
MPAGLRRGHHLGTAGDFSESASLGAATGSRNAHPGGERLLLSHRHQLAFHRPNLNSLTAFAMASTSVSASPSSLSAPSGDPCGLHSTAGLTPPG